MITDYIRKNACIKRRQAFGSATHVLAKCWVTDSYVNKMCCTYRTLHIRFSTLLHARGRIFVSIGGNNIDKQHEIKGTFSREKWV
jgi:hypothetical protein